MSLVPTAFVNIDGLRIRYAHGGREDAPSVLMTSPWPESIAAFRELWPVLEGNFRLWAIDLPGFGHSESRPEILEPHAMGQFLLKAMDVLGIEKAHLIAQDVGTSAALFAVLDRPEAFLSLTVGGGIMHENLALDSLKYLMEASSLEQIAALDGATLVTDSLKKLLPSLSAEALDDYQVSYKGERFVISAGYVRTYHQWLPRLRAALPTIHVPVNVLYGRFDPLVPQVHGEILARRLPNVRHTPLDCGHLAWEERPVEYNASLLDWITTGYRGFDL